MMAGSKWLREDRITNAIKAVSAWSTRSGPGVVDVQAEANHYQRVRIFLECGGGATDTVG
jgi:hypothetical protein